MGVFWWGVCSVVGVCLVGYLFFVWVVVSCLKVMV